MKKCAERNQHEQKICFLGNLERSKRVKLLFFVLLLIDYIKIQSSNIAPFNPPQSYVPKIIEQLWIVRTLVCGFFWLNI